MSESRRHFFQNAAVLAAALFGMNKSVAAAAHSPNRNDRSSANVPRSGAAAPPPMITPDIADLAHAMDGAVKVFRLIAEPVKRKIAPFKTLNVWGYNGSCPGPAIQVQQGDRVRVLFENRLPESTSLHWHGLEVPIEQDGVPFISQEPVPPGGKYTYEFTVHQEGTFFYHAHSAMQEMMGLIGMFVSHPKKEFLPRVDHDFGLVLQEWAVLPNNTVPNTAAMEFNWLTFNGVSAPAITPMIVRLGSRVRLRIVNLGMDHHPIHLHGNQVAITGTEGGRAPESTWYPTNTVLVGVAQAKVIEFQAKYPGAWMVHCHLPHHMMNNMMDLLRDRQIQTANTNDAQALSQMQTLANRTGFEHMHHSPIADNAASVPGFPQDAFMEMAMDEAVAKPETEGLPKNWSAGMMGMMTLVRVLPENEYDDFMRRKTAAIKAAATRAALALALLVGIAAMSWPASAQQSGGTGQMNMSEQEMQKHEQHHEMQMPEVRAEFPRMGRMLERSKGIAFTLEQAQKLAEQFNPTLREADAEIQAAKARQQQAGFYPNPVVGYSGDEIRGGSINGGKQGFFVQQTLVTGKKLHLNQSIFVTEFKLAQIEAQEQRDRVENAVKTAYVRVLAAQELLDARSDLAKIAEDAAETQRQLHNTGQADETEVLSAEIDAHRLRLRARTQENTLREQWRSLSAVMGQPGMPPQTVSGDLEAGLPQLDEEQIVEAIARQSPAVSIAQAASVRSAMVTARAQKEIIPDLQIRAGMLYNNEPIGNANRAIGWEGVAEVGVQIPIFNRNQGNIAAARADIDRAEQEKKRVELTLRERVASVLDQYANAKLVVDQYHLEILPRAKKSYQLMVDKYGLMLASYPRVLESRRKLYEFQVEYILALESVWTNGIALRGHLLTDGLESPARPSEVDRTIRETNMPRAERTTPPGDTMPQP
jgi:outer membrane protein TolC